MLDSAKREKKIKALRRQLEQLYAERREEEHAIRLAAEKERKLMEKERRLSFLRYKATSARKSFGCPTPVLGLARNPGTKGSLAPREVLTYAKDKRQLPAEIVPAVYLPFFSVEHGRMSKTEILSPELKYDDFSKYLWGMFKRDMSAYWHA